MSDLKSDFLKTLQARGYINQCTDLEGLDALACAGPITAYVGFDATADSLHIGNLVSLMMLRILHNLGGTPIALLGTGTTKIGDPSDKNTQRPMLTDAQIKENTNGIVWAFDRILCPPMGEHSRYKTKIVQNGDWLDNINYLEFMRSVGKHFTINRMITMDFVRNRLENQLPLTLLEFNYMILQAYDFVQLNMLHGCVLQIGGSDQWGNIVNGVDLGRRMFNQDLFGLTTNLITTSSGNKMGKTEKGAVWLHPSKTTPYEYFQFWRNTEDSDVFRFLKLFTDAPLEWIEDQRLQVDQGMNINKVKESLAYKATMILHGVEAAQDAFDTAQAVFAYTGGNLSNLPSTDFVDGMTVAQAVMHLGLAKSNNEVRRLSQQNGLKMNDRPTVWDAVLCRNDFSNGIIKISVGKKLHGVVNDIQTK